MELNIQYKIQISYVKGGFVQGSAAVGRNLMPPTAAFENRRFPVLRFPVFAAIQTRNEYCRRFIR